MDTYYYEPRITHRNAFNMANAEMAFQGSVATQYHVYDAAGLFVDSFLKVTNMKKVLGPAKFKKVPARRFTVDVVN